MKKGDVMRLAQAVMSVTALTAGFCSCHEDKKVDVASSLHPDRMPTMMTRNVSTLISDSGVTQYKIVAPVWYVYDETEPPCWKFPDGLYLQKYDRKFNVIASVAADSAVYFKRDRLWRLDGNVEMRKAPSDLFLTQQLFWNQRRRVIYSDSFIHIQTPTHILEGMGFESSENLSSYRVRKPMGVFPVNRDDLSGDGRSESSVSHMQSPRREATVDPLPVTPTEVHS